MSDGHKKDCAGWEDCKCFPGAEVTALRAELLSAREALRVIESGLSAWNHETGTFWDAREWLRKAGMYEADLGEGERVLLEVARAALSLSPKPQDTDKENE